MKVRASDVYKRQLLLHSLFFWCRELERFLYNMRRRSWVTSNMAVLDSIFPVSYTHLDVYKRQLLPFVLHVRVSLSAKVAKKLTS